MQMAAVTTRSATRSPFGSVIIRSVRSGPAPVTPVSTSLPVTSRSMAFVVVTMGVMVVSLEPLPPATPSSGLFGSMPWYCRMRTSGYVAAWLNVTVTLLVREPLMLAA
jgi:hypothetical protein